MSKTPIPAQYIGFGYTSLLEGPIGIIVHTENLFATGASFTTTFVRYATLFQYVAVSAVALVVVMMVLLKKFPSPELPRMRSIVLLMLGCGAILVVYGSSESIYRVLLYLIFPVAVGFGVALKSSSRTKVLVATVIISGLVVNPRMNKKKIVAESLGYS